MRHRLSGYHQHVAGPVQIPIAVYGLNLLLISLLTLLQINYLAHHPELSYHQLTPSWIAIVRRRTAIPVVIVVASIAISIYNPNLGINAYWLLLIFHFLPGKHHRAPEVEPPGVTIGLDGAAWSEWSVLACGEPPCSVAANQDVERHF